MAVQGILPPTFSSRSQTHLVSEWKDFKEQLEMYFMASGQIKIPDKQKVSLLLYQMGRQYIKVYNNDLQFENPEDKTKYDVVVSKLDDYFEPKKLMKSYITKFQKRVQLPNESISNYITELRQLVRLCGFGDKEDDMMAVQLSNGVADPILKKKLWDEHLTLEKVIEKCQTFELRSQSTELYSSDTLSVNVSYVNGSRGRSRGRSYSRSRAAYRGNADSRERHSPGPSRSRGRGGNRHPSNPCSNCGRQHPPRQCPAFGQECLYCGNLGHFEKHCRKKQRNVHSVDLSEGDEYFEGGEYFEYEPVEDFNTLSIYAVGTENNNAKPDPWSILMRTPYENGKGALRMKIDTQAQCNTISKESFDRMSKHVNLTRKPTNSTIRAFGNSVIVPICRIIVDVIVQSYITDPIFPSDHGIQIYR